MVLRLFHAGWLGLIAVAGITVVGCESDRPDPGSYRATIGVCVAFDFGGRGQNAAVEVRLPDRATVLHALTVAARELDMEIKHRGSAATTFVTSIGGHENERAGGFNWLYYVNDELAVESCGTCNLTAHDQVLWKFTSEGL